MGGYDIELPAWENSVINIEKAFFDMINSVATKGYGIFAAANVFKVDENGSLIPIENADILPLSSLYGYILSRDREYGTDLFHAPDVG